jgi:hypothetical protein
LRRPLVGAHALLGGRICKSPEQYKAWSQNLGHENLLTTFSSYGDVAGHRQAEIISMTLTCRVEEPSTASSTRASSFPPNGRAGFTQLWEMGMLDLSIEAIVIDGWRSWEILFRDTPNIREAARKRLADYGYRP